MVEPDLIILDNYFLYAPNRAADGHRSATRLIFNIGEQSYFLNFPTNTFTYILDGPIRYLD